MSMYMDRDNYDQPRMSLNFIDFIVEPLLTSLQELLPQVNSCLSSLYYNRHKWTQIDEENKKKLGITINEPTNNSTDSKAVVEQELEGDSTIHSFSSEESSTGDRMDSPPRVRQAWGDTTNSNSSSSSSGSDTFVVTPAKVTSANGTITRVIQKKKK